MNLNNTIYSYSCVKTNATTPLHLGFVLNKIRTEQKCKILQLVFSDSNVTNMKPVTNFGFTTTKRIYFHSITPKKSVENNSNFNLAPSYTRQFKIGLHTKVYKNRSQFLAECFGDLSVMLDTNEINVELQNKI